MENIEKYNWKRSWELFAGTHIASIGHNLAKYITCNVNPLFYVNSVNDSIVVQYVSVAQVRNAIKCLKDSSPGCDHLSPFVMKQCVDT